LNTWLLQAEQDQVLVVVGQVVTEQLQVFQSQVTPHIL